MSRIARSVSLFAAVAATCLASSSAFALSSVELVWSQHGSSAPLTASASSYVQANIILNGDDAGIAGVGISILFDAVELSAYSVTEHYGMKTGPGPGTTFSPLSPGVNIDNTNGLITGFDSAVGIPFVGCVRCTVNLGSIRFHVKGPSNGGPGDIDVQLAVLQNGLDGIVASDGSLVTVPLGQLTLNQSGGVPGIPEPGAALLFAMGSLLVAANLRRRQ